MSGIQQSAPRRESIALTVQALGAVVVLFGIWIARRGSAAA